MSKKKSAKAQPKKQVKAQVNVQPKKQVKVQKKKNSVETTLLQDFSSQKEKRALKVKEVDEKVAKLNKDFMSKKKSAKAQPKKQVKAQPKKQVKVQKKKKKHSVETTLLQDFSSQKEKRALKVKEVDEKVAK